MVVFSSQKIILLNSMIMTICIINVDYQPQFIGGIQRVSHILATEWIKNGHSVMLLTITPSSIRKDIINGIPQFYLPDHITRNSPKNIHYFQNLIRERNVEIVVNQHVEEHDVCDLCYKIKQQTTIKLVSTLHFSPTHRKDVIHNSFFIPYKLGNKVKRYIFDCLLFCKFWLYTNPHSEKREGAYFHQLYNQSDRIVLLSDKFKPVFAKKANLSDSSKLIAINDPASVANHDLSTPKEKMVVWCGRLGYDMKRTDKILSIWKRISSRFPEWELKILGSGDELYFKELAKHFHIPNIEIVGFCNPDKYYKKASILCMTSVTEGWGMVLIEAQSYKCVPIAYNSYASLTDIITDGENGFTVTPFDENEYVEKLSELMDSPSLRNKMAENGIQSIHRFDSSKIANQWINLFNELLNH